MRFIKSRGSLSAGLAPITALVDCDGARHRLTLDGRSLFQHDHDADSEEALRALGGALPICLELTRAWPQALRSPGAMLYLADPSQVAQRRRVDIAHARLLAIHLGGHRRIRGTPATAVLVRVPPSRLPDPDAPPPKKDDVHTVSVILSRAPDAMLRRMVLALLDEPANAGDHRQSLESVLRMATDRAFRRMAPGGDRMRRPWATLTDGPAALRRRDRWVHVELPASWLREVWLPVITRVDGWFVMELHGVDPYQRRARLLKLDRAGEPRLATATIRRDHGGWRIASLEAESPRE